MLAIVKRLLTSECWKVAVRLVYKCDSCGYAHIEQRCYSGEALAGESAFISKISRSQSFVGDGLYIDTDNWVVEVERRDGKKSKTFKFDSIERVTIHQCTKTKWGFAHLQSIEDITHSL